MTTAQIVGMVAFGALPFIAIVACIVCNSWYEHRKALRDIRYASEIRRARKLAEIEDEL